MPTINTYDVIIIGAGAAGLMCAIEAGKRQRHVLLLDHANKVGKKILLSGGGRCNFTNYYVQPECYLSHNPHFCKAALSRYTPQHFLSLIHKHQIPYHEKKLGQLFCDRKSHDIVDLLLKELSTLPVTIELNQKVTGISKGENYFTLQATEKILHCHSLVIASGGLSFPTLGASPFGYQIAQQFGLAIYPTRAGLVPLTLQPEDKDRYGILSGIALPCSVQVAGTRFEDDFLFTHRGLSGPSVLQISSYWTPGMTLQFNLFPQGDLYQTLYQAKQEKSAKKLKTILAHFFSHRLVDLLMDPHLAEKNIRACSHTELRQVCKAFTCFNIKPNGTEGYRTAEVTLGGVDCNELSSKTMEAKKVPGLYFIGEVLDVTGWLGGYNFQWAWASGFAAGQVV